MTSSSTYAAFPSYPVDDRAIASRVDLLRLTGADTRLQPAAGGDYAGACPFCGGRDRFRVRVAGPDGERWRCRHCTGSSSDPAAWRDAVDYAARRHNLGYLEACRHLMGPLALPLRPPPRLPAREALPLAPAPPAPAWQAAASAAAERSQQRLLAGAHWLDQQQVSVHASAAALEDAPEAAHAYLWLRQLGLQPATIREAGLGFNPAWEELPGGRWLAPGITVPARVDGHLWYVRVRVNPRYPGDTTRYRDLPGGRAQMVYNLESLRSRPYGVLVEDELDALLLQQEAGDMVGAGAYPHPAALTRRWRRALGHVRHLFTHSRSGRPPHEKAISPLPGRSGLSRGLAAYRVQGGNLRQLVRDALATTPDAGSLRSLTGKLLAALPGPPPASALANYRELAGSAAPYHPPAFPTGRLSLLRLAEDWSEWALYDEGRQVRLLNAPQARAAALGQYDPLLLALGELVAR
jgi:hypothetical protein